MGLNDWWYYTGPTTKAITIIGLISLALLTIIIASPHISACTTNKCGVKDVGGCVGKVEI